MFSLHISKAKPNTRVYVSALYDWVEAAVFSLICVVVVFTFFFRIVGVDGPRWMLRGIFSGKAVTDSDHAETKALNQLFSNIVVERGEDPLAPRDLIPMHPPVAPAERKAAKEAAEAEQAGRTMDIPGQPKGPFDSDQQVEVKTTLSRGPMFSEVR